MNKTPTTLKRDLARLEVDAATLHRHYAGSPDFMVELSGLACDILLSAGEEDRPWVRTAIDRILDRYGVASTPWLENAQAHHAPAATADEHVALPS